MIKIVVVHLCKYFLFVSRYVVTDLTLFFCSREVKILITLAKLNPMSRNERFLCWSEQGNVARVCIVTCLVLVSIIPTKKRLAILSSFSKYFEIHLCHFCLISR